MFWKGLAARQQFDSKQLPRGDLTRDDQDSCHKTGLNVSNHLRRSAQRSFDGVQIQNQLAAALFHEFLKTGEGAESFSALRLNVRRERIQGLDDNGEVFNRQNVPVTNPHRAPFTSPLHLTLQPANNNFLVINRQSY